MGSLFAKEETPAPTFTNKSSYPQYRPYETTARREETPAPTFTNKSSYPQYRPYETTARREETPAPTFTNKSSYPQYRTYETTSRRDPPTYYRQEAIISNGRPVGVVYKEYPDDSLGLEEELIGQIQRLSISKRISQPVPVEINSAVISEFLQSSYGDYAFSNNFTGIYTITLLEDTSFEFLAIKRLFTCTNKKVYSITSIEKIYNPYLLMQYKLMQERYRRRYGHVEEKLLFHGTRKSNIDNICKHNFDWRRKGQALGHKFGQGVSFTPISNYATHYSDKTYQKSMIVANVIVSNKCVGNQYTVIPPNNCDTTIKENEHVLVKYEDNTFYPAYIVHYQGVERKVNNRNRHIFYD